MTDSIRANNTTAAGGPFFAVDTINSTNYAITKIALGVDGNDDGLVNSSLGLPITAYGVVSTYATGGGVVSTFGVNQVNGSSWISGQDTPVSTYQVNTPTPAGVQSTFAVNNLASSGTMSTWIAGAAKTSTHIAGQTGPVSSYVVGTISSSFVQSTFTVNGGGNTTTYINGQASPVSTYIVGAETGNAEYSTKSGFNQTSGSFVMIGALADYAVASTGVVVGSTYPFLMDSTGAVVVRDLSGAAAAANPNSSFIMGSAAGSVPVSTYAVNNPAPVGVQSTWALGVQSTWTIGAAKTSTHIASQTGPVSTFAVNSANPAGVQSTYAVNTLVSSAVISTFSVAGSAKTSTHIASQTGPVSTFAVNNVTTVPIAVSTGGLSVANSVSLTTAALQVKNAPAQMFGFDFTNTATSTRWLKFYDAGAVIVGTTPPNYVVGLPSMSSFSNAITGFKTVGSFGLQFNTSCFVAATTGQATSDTGAPATNEVTVNVFYK